ncbi:MAG: metal ABC transporter ATP-binding protein [Actinomycetes bacterium]
MTGLQTFTQQPLVDVVDLGVSSGSQPILEHISLQVAPGDLIGIVGPSGAGKTTLLRAIAGTIRPQAGSVRLSPDLRVGYVPQVETVNWNFPTTVNECVLMARTSRRFAWPTKVEKALVASVLARLELDGLADRHIRELSGGQQQRVFIARALLRSPDLLLLDEPTSGVDVALRHELLHLLAELRSDGMSVVLTTHDLNGVATHLPTLACLNRTIIACGETSSVLTPEILELTYGASMEVLEHGGMRLIVDSPEHTHPGFAHSVRPLVEENQR